MFAQAVLWRLPSAAMTDQEDAEARRRGYWLKRARERAGVKLSDAAQVAGLSAASGSTVSLWERGLRPIQVQQLRRLARRYAVPVSLFISPELTDDDRIEMAIEAASAQERADWAGEQGQGPADEGGRGGAPRTPSA